MHVQPDQGMLCLHIQCREPRRFYISTCQGPVVQSIVSLTSLLRGQLIKWFTSIFSNTLIFFVGKMRDAFALQKLLTFFSTKNIGKFQILTFEILTKHELMMLLVLKQPGPGILFNLHHNFKSTAHALAY